MNLPADLPTDDPVLERLRAARPAPATALLDPAAPAARDLADRITGRRARTRRPAVARRVAAMAAAAAVVVAAVVVGPWGSSEPRPAAAIVREAAAASARALTSGRAVVTSPDGDLELGDAVTYTFAGDDMSATFDGIEVGGVPYAAARRVVDGERYFHWTPAGAPTEWLHDVTVGSVEIGPFVFDPRGLLAVLEPDADFEVVGDDTVDGVDVTRLRATTPEAVDAAALQLGQATAAGTPTALEVWVDGDGVTRRIDLTVSVEQGLEIDPVAGTSIPLPPQVSSYSVRFTDIGAPLTVEAPAVTRDADFADLAG